MDNRMWRALLGLSDNVSASEAIYRTFARFMASGGIFFGVILAPHIMSQAAVVADWLTPLTIIIVLVPLIGMFPVSFLADIRWIGRLGSLTAIGWMVSALLWLATRTDVSISPQQDVWLSTFPAIAAMATAFSWRVWATVLYLIASSTLAQVLHFVSRSDQNVANLLPQIAFITTFCALFVAATLAAMRSGETLDNAVVSAREQSANTASAEAKNLERKRFDSFVHDKVMSTLLALAREGVTEELMERARKTVTEIQDVADETWSEHPLTMAAACSVIKEAIRAVSSRVEIVEDLDPDSSTVEIPAYVARAFAVASAEAMQNSLTHAAVGGREVDRIVDLYTAGSRLEVVIADNGAGFDPVKVAPDRLGLVTSVVGQVGGIQGAEAVIKSRPNEGTSIMLSWGP